MHKRTKIAISSSSNEPIADVEMTDPNVAAAVNIGLSSPVMLLAPAPAGAEPLDADAVAAIAGTNNSGSSKGKGRAEGEALEPEEVYLEREAEELEALVPEDIKGDEGASWTGLYELVGIVTHKGAAADSGHYIAYVKRRAIKFGTEANAQDLPDDDDEWYKFDDDKVSLFPKDKLNTLDGGGKFEDALGVEYELTFSCRRGCIRICPAVPQRRDQRLLKVGSGVMLSTVIKHWCTFLETNTCV